VQREAASTSALASRLGRGPVKQAGPPTPLFTNLHQRLARAGIRMELHEERLTFHVAAPEHNILKLAQPVPHPWLRGHRLGRGWGI